MLAQQTRPPDTVQAVLDLIQRQRLKVGTKLPSIRDLAAQLGVKTTEVRDALLEAQTMGLVRVVPRSGAFVQSISYEPLVDALARTIQPALLQQDHNLFHLLDARRVIEIELVGRAARLRRVEDLLPVKDALQAMSAATSSEARPEYVENDIRFHVEIARIADNSVLFTMQQAMLELLRPHLAAMPWSSDHWERTQRSHTKIYAALVAGDADAAREEMRAHLGLAYDNLLNDVQQVTSVGSPAAESEM